MRPQLRASNEGLFSLLTRPPSRRHGAAFSQQAVRYASTGGSPGHHFPCYAGNPGISITGLTSTVPLRAMGIFAATARASSRFFA